MVVRREDPSDAWVDIADNISSTTFTDNSLTDGTSYYYALYASNASTQSQSSSTFSATPSSSNLNLPTPGFFYAVFNATAGNCYLEWDAGNNWIPSATAVIERFDNGSQSWHQLATVKGNYEDWLDQGLSPKMQYLYRLHFVTNTGSSASIQAFSKGQTAPDFAVIPLSGFSPTGMNNNGILSGSNGYWKNGTYTPIDGLNGGTPYPLFVNDQGHMAGYSYRTTQFGSAFDYFFWNGSTQNIGTYTYSGLGSYYIDVEGLNNSNVILALAHNIRLPQGGHMVTSNAGSPWASVMSSTVQGAYFLNDLNEAVPTGSTPLLESLSGTANAMPDGFSPRALNNNNVVGGSLPTFDYTRFQAKQWSIATGLKDAGELALPDNYLDGAVTSINDSNNTVGYSGYNEFFTYGNEVYDLNDICSTSQIGFPEKLNNRQMIWADNASSGDSLLLVPFLLQGAYASSGFDTQSDPHWLMVPENGSNSVSINSAANSDMTLTFNPESGSSLTVSPASTTNTNEYLTITSASVIASSDVHVQVGVGSANGTSGGLNVAVKRQQTVKIAIHAITQHDGIGPDIPPITVPSASDLQTYLNEVYGPQTNTYFTVVRSDFSVDYDEDSTNSNPTLSGYKDGKLDLPPAHIAGAVGDEEKRVNDVAMDNTARFNIYYVHDFVTTSVATGCTFFDNHTTWVRDTSTPDHVFYATAHEIGHQFGIFAHANEPTFALNGPSGGSPNPTFLPSTDAQQQQRLMYGGDLANKPTLLVKPEWDIINQ